MQTTEIFIKFPDARNQSERGINPNLVNQVVGPRKARKYVFIVGTLVSSALGSLLWGVKYSANAAAVLFIDDSFELNATWHEIIVSVMIVGAAFGAVTSGALNDKFGRRKVLMISALLYCVGDFIMAVAINIAFLVIGRTIVGLAIGMCYIATHSYSYM